jgi:hypothetical protein
MAALQGATLVQINGSAAVLALAKSAGFDSVEAFMPGLQMFWNDVSTSNMAVSSSPLHSPGPEGYSGSLHWQLACTLLHGGCPEVT